MPTYTTMVDLCGGCGYVLPDVNSGYQAETLCNDCGKDVKLFRDRVAVVVRDADLGDFKRLINSRRREEKGVILNEAEKEKMKEYHESAKRDK